MKKIVLIILIGMAFISCTKVPFIPKKPVENAALVYVYALPDNGSNDAERIPYYKVLINGKTTKGFVKEFEYATYNLKPMSVVLSGARNDIEIKNLSLNLEEGETYYIRIQSYSDDFGKFNLTLVEEAEALEELKSTDLAGEYDKADSVIHALIESEKDDNTMKGMTAEQLEALIDKKVAEKTAGTSSVSSSSPTLTRTGNKLEDIRNAYEMKKQGLLSEEEFLKMKSEILAK